MNPDKLCNFDCVYCEVNRRGLQQPRPLDINAMVSELEKALDLAHSGEIRQLSSYRSLPEELLKLRHVALSGDGEPTLCPNFLEVVESVVHLRARGTAPFFKLVLITNSSGLDLPQVTEGLRLFTPRDDVWAKLDVGTQEHMNRLNKAGCNIEKVLENILALGRERPIVIQSLFASIAGIQPSEEEIEAYVRRLKDLKDAGAQIKLVQVYSAYRPTAHPDCMHLPLTRLSTIARKVREGTGFKAEVF